MELELDSRIKAGKRPLNCFDTEQAMQFIGKQCYFSDDATDFMDLDKADGDSMFYIAELKNIWTAEEYCFADNSNDFRFILPLDFVKNEPEEITRPFTLKEFLEKFKIMYPIRMRSKINPNYESVGALVGWEENKKDRSKDGVVIAGHYYCFNFLYLHMEYEENGQWYPFSIQETKGE